MLATSATLVCGQGRRAKITSKKIKPQSEIALRVKHWVVPVLLFVSPKQQENVFFLSFYIVLEQCF